MGILQDNINFFAGIYTAAVEQVGAKKVALATERVDGIARFLEHALVSGKFFSLFSLLFGIGFSIQLGKADDRAARALYARRLGWLALFGLTHLLLWNGDILLLYALTGFAMLPLRRVGDRALLVSAGGLVVAPVALYWVTAATHGAFNPARSIGAIAERVDLALGFTARRTPSLLEQVFGGHDALAIVRLNVGGAINRYGRLVGEGRPFKVLAMFLLGVIVGRRQLFRNGAEPGLLRRVFLIGVAVGVPANLWMAALLRDGAGPVTDLQRLWISIAFAVGVVPLSVGMTAGIALLWNRPIGKRVLSWLAPAGRMALTNYLGQSVLGIAIFYGVGLGLYGTMGQAQAMLMAFAIFVAQALTSRVWLARYQYGPLEWIWRQATYRRRFPLRGGA